MKNILITCSLSFLSLSAFCQEKDSIKQSRFSFGIYYSPELCYRQLAYSETQQWVANIRNEEEQAKDGFSSGLILKMTLNKRFSIETGATYSNKTGRVKKSDLLWADSDPSFSSSSRTAFAMSYINVPVKVNYFLSSKRVRYYVSLGVITSRFLTKRTIVQLYDADRKTSSQSSTQSLGYNKINFSTAIGVGVNYQISKTISFNLEPVYQQSITSIRSEKNAKEYLYSIGLNTGLLYHFR